ncbi:interleukin-5 receptor subunit alpha-like isoform X2 [Carettochelys insculpta]|uniref:interleukin-5 receptor subunit alpha-like isoform X2 n=1 Tax=Carettochelys insculpta TaxID=44489 RepID=UPI003EBFAB8D
MVQLRLGSCFCLALTCYEVIVVSLANGQPATPASLVAPSDLRIVKKDFGVILSWDSNITEEMEIYSVKYILKYKFDRTKEVIERVSEKKKMIRLNLHSGFHAKVKTQLFLKETDDIIKESQWAEFTYRAPPVYIQNLSCIIYNLFNLNCSWDIKTEAPEDAQYFFSFWHSSTEFQCQLYLTNAKLKNIGCHMKEVYFNPAYPIKLNITVRELYNSSKYHSYYKKFQPQRLEKLNPPINVSVSLESRSVKVNWKPPPTIGSAKRNCFIYQVKITDLEPTDVSEEEYVHPVYDPTKQYIFQVRARKTECVRNKIWSEWTEPIVINEGYEKNKLETWQLLILISFAFMIFTGLLIFQCRRYKCTPIPVPSEEIRTWLTSDAVQYK